MHTCTYAHICERAHMWCRAVLNAAFEGALGAACTHVRTLTFVYARIHLYTHIHMSIHLNMST